MGQALRGGRAALAIVGGGWAAAFALSAAAAGEPDLTDFRTVTTCQQAEIKGRPGGPPPAPGRTGYLGVSFQANEHAKLIVSEVADASPAAKAGLLKGDELHSLDGLPITSAAAFREAVQALQPGTTIKLAFRRGSEDKVLAATLDATSKPLSASLQRVVLGVTMSDVQNVAGLVIRQITDNGPAAKAGLKSGDVIASVDGTELTDSASLREALAGKNPGDRVKVLVKRDQSEQEYEIELSADTAGATASRNDRGGGLTAWRRDVYRLAVVCIEYPDTKHNDKITREDWERSLFSEGRYQDKSATGQTVYGSVNDYYRELSCGRLRVEGQVFDWVEVSKKRGDYAAATATDRTALLGEALDKLRDREGKNVLRDFDGVFFIYAGGRFRTNRGGIYWPHRGSVTYSGARTAYFIVPEGGEQMTNISVIAHEFGHMLGLPDLYARPENPGSEGLSLWCAMSNQAGAGRPQHMSAWCKERLGWLKPAVIDPTVPQKLILGPVEGSDRECYKVLLRADGSEYLLLENRRKQGFDASLPSEGLLIWRVVGSRPMLEESHGIEGPAGPSSYRDLVPYPTRANDSFTPYTVPSSRSQLGGGLPVHITNIHELADGRITFYIGYEFE